jgi:uncharacterized protein YuzE
MRLSYHRETDSLYIHLSDRPGADASELVKNSSAVARVSPGVPGKARCVKTRELAEANDRSFRVAQRRQGRSAAAAVGGRFFHRLSEVAEGVVLDFEEAGALVGIDVQHASRIADLSKLLVEHLPAAA